MKKIWLLIISVSFVLMFGLAYAGIKHIRGDAPPHKAAQKGEFEVIKGDLPSGVEILEPTRVPKSQVLHRMPIPKEEPLSKSVEPVSKSKLRRWESEQTKKWRQYLIDEGWVNPDGSQKYIPGEVVVQFNNEVRSQIEPSITEGVSCFGIMSVDQINEKYNALTLERVIKDETIKAGTETSIEKHGLDLIYLITFPQNSDVKKIVDEYEKDPAVKEASPNWQLYPLNIPQKSVPDDPYYAQTPWSWDDMKCREAWYVNTGASSVKICHIALGPSAAQGAHPDYTNSDLDLNYFGSGGGSAGSATNHATCCTGCMAAENNNNYGQCGVAGGWGATQGCSWTYYGMRNSTTYEILAFRWGADNNCIVENASFGGGAPGAGVEAAVNYAVDNGCLVTASSGNADYPEISYPAYFGNAIAVGATQAGDENIFVYGPWVECIATGGQYSIAYNGMAWGTSFSAPKAAGVIGLIKSQHSGWNVSQIRAALNDCADWVDYIPANAGRSGLMGGGRVNPYESMRVFDKNVSLNLIYRPSCNDGDSVDAYSSVTPQVVVQNRGINRETFIVVCRIDTITGANLYADTQFVDGLADRSDKVNKGRLVSFDDWSVGGPSAKYLITTYTTLSGDENYVNDTIRDTVYVKSSGGAGEVWLRRNDADTPSGVGAGYADNDYTVYLPAPAAPCSIIGARVWVENANARVCTLWVGPDSATHSNRYAPVKPWPGQGNMWVEKVFTPNNNSWTEINFTNPEKYWLASPQGFHVTIYTPTADVQLCGDNPAEYQDVDGYYARNNDPHDAWGWTYIYSSGEFVFFLQAKIKYVTCNNDVSVTELIRPKEHEIDQIPLIPKAVVKNVGEYAQSNFNVTLKIDSTGNQIYTDTKTITKTLGKFDVDTVTFTGWVPQWNNGTYNARCYTQLGGDQDYSNDTLYRDVLSNNLDTLAYDDNSAYWIYTDINCYWAVTFYPARPCSVIGADYMLYVGGMSVPPSCTLFAYEAANDTPVTKLWTKVRVPVNGWNTYNFNNLEKFDRPNTEDFSLVLWTYGLQGGDTICPRFDNTDEAPWHSYANTGTGWGSPIIYDMMMRARIKYYGSPYNHDIGVASIDNPLPYDWVYPNSPIIPQVTVENFGLNSETFNVVFIIDDSLGITEWADTVNTSISVAEIKQVSFDTWQPQEPDMDYLMKAYTILGGDENHANDTLDDPVYCRTINVISYNEETWGDLGIADEYYAVRFTPERPCTVWGALINIWPNRDNCTAPCTLFLWKDTLDRPVSGTYIDHVAFTPDGVGANQGGYIYQIRQDFTSGSDGSNYEVDSDFWLGMFARVSGADTVLVPFSDFADYENVDGRSLANSDRSNTDEWYSPTWISGADTCQADWEIKALVKYLSYPGDAPLPPDIMVNKQSNNAVLVWDSVKTDVSGNPITCDHYTTYRSTSVDFIPGMNSFLDAGPDTTITDNNALLAGNNYYYLTYAFNTYGTKSDKSNMGYVLRKQVNENPSASDRNWVSLPYNSEYTTVSDLTTDLSPSGDPLTAITNLRDDQLYESWLWDPDFLIWDGTDFVLEPGRAYEVEAMNDTFLILVGANDPNGLISLNYNADKSDRNWISIPYNAAYSTVSDITTDYSPAGDPLTAITNLRDDQLYESWLWDPDFLIWDGTDFVLEPGRGYEFDVGVTHDTVWNPTEYSNRTMGIILAKKIASSDLELHIGTLIEPDRAPSWIVRDDRESDKELLKPEVYNNAERYEPVLGAFSKKQDYREVGVSHIVRAHLELEKYNNVVFTAYRPDRSNDALTEKMVGCGVAKKGNLGAIWFDVGNFMKPWQDGEELILIIEVTKEHRGYFAVLDFPLSSNVDIQELGKVELMPIPEPVVSKSSVAWNGIDNDNTVGYSIYKGDTKLNNKVITTNEYSTTGDIIALRPVIKGGYETVHGSQGAPVERIPLSYAFAIYPNPFAKQTRINYALPERAAVEVKVYDVCGKLVKTLVSEKLDPGYYEIFWQGRDNLGRKVASGVYFIQINTKGFESQRKLIFVR